MPAAADSGATPAAAAALKDRFRVFVRATTEDLLHSESVLMHDYYKDSLGLPTWGDLAVPGGRCAEGAVSPEEALDWLLADGGTPTPAAAPSEAHRDDDGDGIGDHLDSEDDNDGVPDSADDKPQGGAGSAAMRLQELQEGYNGWENALPVLQARMHLTKPVGFSYPKGRGDRQFYQYVALGDGPSVDVQVMVDRF